MRFILLVLVTGACNYEPTVLPTDEERLAAKLERCVIGEKYDLNRLSQRFQWVNGRKFLITEQCEVEDVTCCGVGIAMNGNHLPKDEIPVCH